MEPHNNNEAETPGTEERSSEWTECRARAEAIVEAGSYARILEGFAGVPGLLPEMMEDLKRREAFLITEAPYLSEGDWKILTCLELFDRATFEHCERTWALAKEKLESVAPVGIHFRELLAREGLSVDNILRACLLHDCGKMCLDKQILNDTHTDLEWEMANEAFCTRAYSENVAGERVLELKKYLGEHPGHRAIHKVPYKALAELGDAERQMVERLKTKGFDTSLSLAALIETHQERSGETLATEDGDDSAAFLVANHHPKRFVAEEKYPIGLSVVRAGMTLSTELGRVLDVLRLSDIYDAYHSARVYKPGHPTLAALEYLMREADRGVIDPVVAREWVEDSVANLEKEEYFAQLTDHTEQKEHDGTLPKVELLRPEQLLDEEKIAREKLRARGILKF
ncbi:MAG TPA: hypothetical protein VJJ02_04450 [Candidatus Paceibacterota bacterium]